MRSIYVCIGCGVVYLPPESMTYPSHPEVTASSAHCGKPSCATAAGEAAVMSGLPEERLGELARRARGMEGEPRRPRRVRLAARRAGAAPGEGRDKLR